MTSKYEKMISGQLYNPTKIKSSETWLTLTDRQLSSRS